MVIAIHTSDSCNTLVSLDNHHNASSKQQGSSCQGSCCPTSTEEFRKTSLLVPVDELDFSEDSLDSSYGFCSCEPREQRQSLFLPTTAPVDEYLQQIPALRDVCDELLACNHHQFTEASPEKLIYVHQGELAHALASQCDVLVSDRATTCHIMAIRSTCADESKQAMASLTHIDSDQYEACVREMVQAHKKYHGVSKAIEMDIHIMGGFVDEEGHSQKISNWLLHLLADIAAEQAASIQMKLQTCAISSINDNGFQCPVGRGMAIHVATGRVFLAKASTQVLGPHMALRNARLWSAGEGPQTSQLQVVHTTTSNEILITPFSFQALPGMDKLMALPDEILLEYTSTSPSVEEEDFCPMIRATLRFLLEVPSARIFGRLCDRTLRFTRRQEHSNQWMLTA